MEYYLRYVDRDRDESFVLESLDTILTLAASLRFEELFVNHACSFFDDSLLIGRLLPHLKNLTGATLTIAAHDYFTVCPSWTLIDDTGRFCGVPDITRCRQCLPNIRSEVRSLVGCDDIDRWRTLWGRCLEEATTILCFSGASMELIRRAYPNLSADKFVVRPHAVDYLPKPKLRLSLDAPLNIGVVGMIPEAKGAGIVREMARLIKERQLAVKITVIGRIDQVRESPIVHITGRYERHELPQLIQKSGANVFLLPSVWPETFSYVAGELMHMGLPLAVFRLGAQAERVASYPNGLLIEETNAEHALEQLIGFQARLRRMHGSVFLT
jgi:glycosyltransferase involved in cell wall biosynthesis